MPRCIFYICKIHIHTNIKDVYCKINQKYIGPGSNQIISKTKKKKKKIKKEKKLINV